MFFGLVLQSPRALTAAFPSDAQPAASGCFPCLRRAPPRRGNRKGLRGFFHRAPFHGCTAPSAPFKTRAERAGGAERCPRPPTLFPGQNLFPQGERSASRTGFQMVFCSSASLLPAGLRVPGGCWCNSESSGEPQQELLLIVPEFHNC